MTLTWVPGEPSGPTRQVYYKTAYHPGGNFTLCVTYHSGVPKYGLTRGAGKTELFDLNRDALARAEELCQA